MLKYKLLPMTRLQTDFKKKVKPRYGFRKHISSFYKANQPRTFEFIPRYYEDEDLEDFEARIAKAKGEEYPQHASRIREAFAREDQNNNRRVALRLIMIITVLALLTYKFLLQ